jgi:hypothetical protein
MVWSCNTKHVRNDAEKELRFLSEEIQGGRVARVRVVEVPAHILTRVALSPQMLEAQATCSSDIDIRGDARRTLLASTLESAAVDPAPSPGDLRWGLILFDVDGQRVGGVYSDHWRVQGAVNDRAFVLLSVRWARLVRAFSACD